jgi:hypothetical protein
MLQPCPLPFQVSLFYVSGREIKYGISDAYIKHISSLAFYFHTLLPKKKIADNTIIFFHYDSEVSNYLMAYIRAIQIEMLEIFKETFFLRIAEIKWHPALEGPHMKIPDRSNLTASYYDDPNVEFVTICNNKIVPVSISKPYSPAKHFLPANQFIQSVHEKGVNIEPVSYNPDETFIKTRLNKAVEFGRQADILIAEDILFDFPVPLKSESSVYQSLLPEVVKLVGDLRDLHFSISDPHNAMHQYLCIYKHSLLFDLNEPGNADPALLAHAKGISTEKLEDAEYMFGFNLYMEKVFGLLRKMGFTNEFVDEIRYYYNNLDNINRIRINISKYANSYYDITDEQFTCLAYRPFNNEGKNLHHFLLREHHSLLRHENRIRKILGEKTNKYFGRELVKKLVRISGLSLEQLRKLYQKKGMS